MSQPKWKLLANLGDVNPIDHGGLFVYIDETGVYPPEMERLEPCGDGTAYDEPVSWEVRRVVLERCTYINGILSDNKFHPELAAWFAKPESERSNRPQDTTYLSNAADCLGNHVDDLILWFCSGDPVLMAMAYRAVGDYHGWENLDSYPLTFDSRADVEARYAEEITA